MRDTIYCSLPRNADRDAIAESIEAMAEEVQSYVPGYRLLGEPQFETVDDINRVTVFVEVEGAGDFLPPYSGNLDIMTAAAARVGDQIASTRTGVES